MPFSNKIEKDHNFFEVCERKLYRSGQPTPDFLSYLKKSYKIKTIVNLRRELENSERDFAKKNEIKLIHIPIRAFSRFPKLEDIKVFLALFENPESYPVLLHCREGKHRTGLMIAVFRLVHERKSLEKVLIEMEQRKTKIHWQLFLKLNAKKISKLSKQL